MPTRTALSLLILSSLAAFSAAAAPEKVPTKSGSTEGVARTAPPQQLKPGEYFWHPEVSPAGPLVMVVSIPDQRANVYRNGVIIGATTVSTGKKGHETPTGVFTVLEKDADHHSNVYNNAPMPYMERLTWSGVALHAGKLPGYPASHGCVRMPYEFAKLLFGETHKGMTVVVSDESQFPSTVAHPGLFAPIDQAGAPIQEPVRVGDYVWQPENAPEGPVSILVSGADGRVRIFRNGVEIGRSPFTLADPGRQLKPHVFTLLDPDGSGSPRWMVVAGQPMDASSTDQLLAGIRIPREFVAKATAAMGPGTTMLVTPTTATGETTPSSPGFTVIASEKEPEAPSKKKG
jgi:lipoprotein-anchoring transpeptidase ErfK/SrfK